MEQLEIFMLTATVGVEFGLLVMGYLILVQILKLRLAANEVAEHLAAIRGRTGRSE